MIRLASFLLMAFVLSGCSNASSDNSPKSDTTKIDYPQPVGTTTVDTALKLDFFKSIPEELEGCGEHFTYDTTELANQRYIFLSNLTEFAIIKIKGADIRLNRDTVESREIDTMNYIAVYTGSGYKVTLKMKQIKKSGDEGGQYSGTLQIVGNKINAIFRVHGDAGC